jgi:hypothetical protein
MRRFETLEKDVNCGACPQMSAFGRAEKDVQTRFVSGSALMTKSGPDFWPAVRLSQIGEKGYESADWRNSATVRTGGQNA